MRFVRKPSAALALERQKAIHLRQVSFDDGIGFLLQPARADTIEPLQPGGRLAHMPEPHPPDILPMPEIPAHVFMLAPADDRFDNLALRSDGRRPVVEAKLVQKLGAGGAVSRWEERR